MNFLEHLARFQHKRALFVILFTLAITVFFVFGVPKIQMETDFSKMQPEGLDIVKLNKKINDKFGGQDIVVIILKLDTNTNSSPEIQDIRDPKIITYLNSLESTITKESSVDQVISPATYLGFFSFQNTENVIEAIKLMPGIEEMYSTDYSTTVMYIVSDLSGSQDKTIALTKMIDDKILTNQPPSGVKIMVTGTAPVSVTVLDILGKDAITTLVLASIIILILLFILERSIIKGIVIFFPIFLGVLWTMGFMGWLGIHLSVGTVGIGAMILGLGIEYSVFMYTRYKEERDKGKSQEESLLKSVPAIGTAILGSGIATIIGFLSLTLSIMPMLSDLGIALAIGIGFILFIVLFIAPTIIILVERLEASFTLWMHNLYSSRKDRIGGI